VLGKLPIIICREGLYFIVVMSFVIVGAMLREINLLILVAGMMVGALGVNLLLVIWSLRRLAIVRRLPEEICAGDALTVELRAENNRRWFGSWMLRLEDRVARVDNPQLSERLQVRTLLPHVPREGTAKTSYRGRLARRGVYQFGPLHVSTFFPLGLLGRSKFIEQLQTLLVLPRIGRLAPRWRDALAADRTDGASSRRKGRSGGEFYGLRDWQPGDTKRWIHWRTSAKRGKLAVRQFEQPRDPDLAIVLDLWLGEEPTPRQHDRVELAISFAATVVAEQCRLGGRRLLVAATGKQPFLVHAEANSALLRDALQHLTRAEGANDSDPSSLLESAKKQASRAARLVLISTKPEGYSTERGTSAGVEPLKISVGSQQFEEMFAVE
jgi:uncharacterized protein (DUF58 family)